MIDQPGIGSYLAPGSPIRFTGTDNLPAMAAPRLGEHTDQILAAIWACRQPRSASSTTKVLSHDPRLQQLVGTSNTKVHEWYSPCWSS
ncbi:MAG: hypothetical protein U5O39_17620 [Gammaproteobacteria bacterium]|nr:hypothetical protein [Gammaproteobacteria bacterium]